MAGCKCSRGGEPSLLKGRIPGVSIRYCRVKWNRTKTPQPHDHRDAYLTCLVSHFIRFWTLRNVIVSESVIHGPTVFQFFFTDSISSKFNIFLGYTKSVQVVACYELSIHLNFVFFFIIVKNWFLVTKLTVFPSPEPHKSRNGCCKEDY